MTIGLSRKLIAEALGAMLLLAIVVGSGVMGERLAADNSAIALLANSIATGAGLTVLILIFGPVSGAHFNPAVTAAFFAAGEIKAAPATLYCCAQLIGALAGVALAHAMFDLEILQLGSTARSGAAATPAASIVLRFPNFVLMGFPLPFNWPSQLTAYGALQSTQVPR